ncbi:hypothetical protein HBH70_208630 [Parastagonospora nodorum]|nr:hypothetical protein HBH50_153110 [Parastagonospora nodorum]KAH4079520.1 hypothetical protein HBH48_219900 [Parastagonospora nodorum]KAH4187472.1 hypothetical protein HBH42_158230 [Parastagonospora nodorum]KAH4901025.1 hypothetical protein HBI80_148100 [Parastagonospora nodorum]KAH5128922.1 hypothetical protein HBH70_208630 [Parastagonospora nodorum]
MEPIYQVTASDMVFNYGTGPESLESKIAMSLYPHRGLVTNRDVAVLAGKIAFIIRYQLCGRITAGEVTVATTDDVNCCAIKIMVHLDPQQMREALCAIARTGQEAIEDLIRQVNTAVDRVFPMEEEGVKKEPSLIEELIAPTKNFSSISALDVFRTR